MRIFVSYYHNLREGAISTHALALVDALRMRAGIVVTSPDPAAWGNWYDQGLPSALNSVQVFVCVVCPAWDSSTWMALEADAALRRYEAGKIQNYFCYDPQKVTHRLPQYRVNPLPEGLAEAAELILAEPRR